ncbi:TIGR04338 family metallohydrolase [Nakamurella endophytica]|uniref:TIGR04338 family metallohydrolase n=1 Tax=Nakamurella endophytica TaxID=1748367 RepID=A0A917SR64_9ACTN|nr:TIGR04338 family metallohydrolase [Nakamurella endophytica]GGL93446.1 hypothetical protein GCM10011594_11630 [Nakamurella endophytica]
MAEPPTPASAPVDRWRSRVYEAQHLVGRIFDRSAGFPVVEVAGSRVTVPVERHFGDVAGVQRYVDGVLQLNWVTVRWPRAGLPVRVRERRGQQRAHYEWASATIAVPVAGRWALRELVLLHEIAHHLGDPPPEPPHGPGFTGRFVELVDGVVGPEAGLLLRVTLADQGVPVG